MQSFIGILYEKYDDNKVYIYDVFTMVCLLSAINVWRGVWSFVTFYAGKFYNSFIASEILLSIFQVITKNMFSFSIHLRGVF